MNKAYLLLGNGTIFEGKPFGSTGTRIGEVVFNTSMTGYQEILTDPSYKGQIVAMTYTEIGNYGVNDNDIESRSSFVEGFVVKEFSKISSNFRAKEDLRDFLVSKNIVGISNIDTRYLTKLLRINGSLPGIISSDIYDINKLKERLNNSDSIIGKDMVQYVTTKQMYEWHESFPVNINNRKMLLCEGKDQKRIVVMDFGVKFNSLRYFKSLGFDVLVVPAYTTYEEIKLLKPACIFLSNGPGDPRGIAQEVVDQVRKIITNFPTFGICLGHQIIARCFNISIYKMKFGHHGSNHPVKNLETKRIYITSQNHNYSVSADDTNQSYFMTTHINLNDHTIEGFKHKNLPIMSVQYHPEASPGPHDSNYVFLEFVKNYL